MNSRLPRAICWTAAAGYFLLIAWPSLAARWAPDDPMNLYNYWHAGPWKIVLSNLLFFSSDYRPLGGLFYLPLFRLAQLNPLPYHIVIDLVLAANVWLLYRFARLLGVAEPAAVFAALLSISHVAMISLLLSPSDSYDAFCFLFFFAALNYYVSIRSRGQALNWRQTGAFLVLYVGALNAKEIGVTLPVFVLIYEQLWHDVKTRRLWTWVRGDGRTVAICGLLAVIYTAGKLFGPNSLATISAYRPEYSFHRFASNNAHFLDDLTYRQKPWFGIAGLATAWAVAAIHAWWRGKPALKFCWFFVVLSPLPIAFIPQRGLYNLYLPLAGWAILVSAAAWDVICGIASTRWLPGRWVTVVRIALAALLITVWTRDRMWRASFHLDVSRQMQAPTWDVIQQFRELHVSLLHGSRVVFLHDPFQSWDLFFIANLCYDDPSLVFFMQRYLSLPPSEIDKMDYIFDWKDGKIVLVRSKRT